MSVLGFAPLQDAPDAALTFVSAQASLWFEGEPIGGRIFSVSRHGVAAAGFQVDPARPGVPMAIAEIARRGELVAVAWSHVDEDSGLVLIDDVSLRRGSPYDATAWPTGRGRDGVNGFSHPWYAPVLIGSMRAVAGSASPRLPAGARAPGDSVAEFDLVGRIEPSAATSQLVNRIKNATGQTIVLNIDSNGGQVAAGRRIYDALIEHPNLVMTNITGRCDSMAPIVLLAGDHRTIDASSRITMHPAHQTMTDANAGDLRKVAADLDRTEAGLAAIVAVRTGHSVDIARAWSEGCFEFNAADALRVGLVHEVVRDRAPRAPTARRVKMAPINGPYASFTPAAMKRIPQFERGRKYSMGERVAFGGRVWMARRDTFGAVGLEPDRNTQDWK